MRWVLVLLVVLLAAGCAALPQQRRQAYVDGQTLIDPDIERCILEGKIRVGMSKAEVIASWGGPARVNSHSDGSAQWVYQGMCYYPRAHRCGTVTYVYLKDGICTSWSRHN